MEPCDPPPCEPCDPPCEPCDPPVLPPDEPELPPEDPGIDALGMDPPPDEPPPEGIEGMEPPPPPLEPCEPPGMLELLPPDEPDEPDEPPLDPEEPPDEPPGLGMLGEGMLEEDCWLAQPPMRKAEMVPTVVICAATTSSRSTNGLLFIAFSGSGRKRFGRRDHPRSPRCRLSCCRRAERGLSIATFARPLDLPCSGYHVRDNPIAAQPPEPVPRTVSLSFTAPQSVWAARSPHHHPRRPGRNAIARPDDRMPCSVRAK